jgi:hypothetical protein
MSVEFTNRYGGRPPSWLLSCHGPCEAMGFYPVRADDHQLTAVETSQIAHRIAEGRVEDDGWYFLRCPACRGTGRVSWLVTVGRVPRWTWRGLRFMWDCRRSEWHPPQWGIARRVWTLFKVAFLCDLGVRP